jgi:hypothetical protein
LASICVFCSSSDRIDSAYIELAGEVGAELARRGHELVSGGGSVSSMGAVARAARAGGARTVGVIPETLRALEVADDDADELVVVEDMRARKGEMDRRAEAFLALAGGLGTLEELLEVWVSRSLGMHTKPIVVLDPDGLYGPLRRQVELLIDKGFVRRKSADQLRWASTAADAITTIEFALAEPTLVVAPGWTPEEMLEAEP